MVRFLVKGCVNKIEVTTYGGGFEQLPLSRGGIIYLKIIKETVVHRNIAAPLLWWLTIFADSTLHLSISIQATLFFYSKLMPATNR
jgi:hypothetical protein